MEGQHRNTEGMTRRLTKQYFYSIMLFLALLNRHLVAVKILLLPVQGPVVLEELARNSAVKPKGYPLGYLHSKYHIILF